MIFKKSNKFLDYSFNKTVFDELERNDQDYPPNISLKSLSTENLKKLDKAIKFLIKEQSIFSP